MGVSFRLKSKKGALVVKGERLPFCLLGTPSFSAIYFVVGQMVNGLNETGNSSLSVLGFTVDAIVSTLNPDLCHCSWFRPASLPILRWF